MESKALKQAIEKAVKETTYQLRGNIFPRFESPALKKALKSINMKII